MLTQQIKLVSEPKGNPFVPDNNKIADVALLQMMVDEALIHILTWTAILTLNKALFDYWLVDFVLLKSFHILPFERYFVLLKVPCLFFFECKNVIPVNKPPLLNKPPPLKFISTNKLSRAYLIIYGKLIFEPVL